MIRSQRLGDDRGPITGVVDPFHWYRAVNLVHVGMRRQEQLEIGWAVEIYRQQMSASGAGADIEGPGSANQGNRGIIDPAVLVEVLPP
jgi:hypothetical protein